MTGFRSGADVRCETKAPKVPPPRPCPIASPSVEKWSFEHPTIRRLTSLCRHQLPPIAPTPCALRHARKPLVSQSRRRGDSKYSRAPPQDDQPMTHQFLPRTQQMLSSLRDRPRFPSTPSSQPLLRTRHPLRGHSDLL